MLGLSVAVDVAGDVTSGVANDGDEGMASQTPKADWQPPVYKIAPVPQNPNCCSQVDCCCYGSNLELLLSACHLTIAAISSATLVCIAARFACLHSGHKASYVSIQSHTGASDDLVQQVHRGSAVRKTDFPTSSDGT